MLIVNIQNNLIEVENAIKALLFKKDSDLTKSLDFDNSECFLEPLLFNLLQNESIDKQQLAQLLQNYRKTIGAIEIESILTSDNIAYISSLGYFSYSLEKINDIVYLENSSIELVIHNIKNLKNVFKTGDEELIDHSKIEISYDLAARFKHKLENAIQIIIKTNQEHFNLIQKCCKKVVLFKANPENTNSFATINAHGIAFLNVFQEEYDEVFFIDDIAHQTGHIILTTLFFNRKNHFKINDKADLALIVDDSAEYRDIYVLLHALYTYYTSINCLKKAIEENLLNSKQTAEARGRIGFYMLKYTSDIRKLNIVYEYFGGRENVLEKEALDLFIEVENYYTLLIEQGSNTFANFSFTNQPYNYTHSVFLDDNKRNL